MPRTKCCAATDVRRRALGAGAACLAVLLGLPGSASGAAPAASPALRTDPTYAALRSARPDGPTFAVTGWTLERDAFRFRFASGRFQFLTPVGGRTIGAVFVGDGSVDLLPAVAVGTASSRLPHGRPQARGALGHVPKPRPDLHRRDRPRRSRRTARRAPRRPTAPPPSTRSSSRSSARTFRTTSSSGRSRISSKARLRRRVSSWRISTGRLCRPPSCSSIRRRWRTGSRRAKSAASAPRSTSAMPKRAATGISPTRWPTSRAGRLSDERSRADALGYTIDTTIQKNARIQATTTVRFEPRVDGLRVLPVALMAKLRVKDAAFESGRGRALVAAPIRSGRRGRGRRSRRDLPRGSPGGPRRAPASDLRRQGRPARRRRRQLSRRRARQLVSEPRHGLGPRFLRPDVSLSQGLSGRFRRSAPPGACRGGRADLRLEGGSPDPRRRLQLREVPPHRALGRGERHDGRRLHEPGRAGLPAPDQLRAREPTRRRTAARLGERQQPGRVGDDRRDQHRAGRRDLLRQAAGGHGLDHAADAGLLRPVLAVARVPALRRGVRPHDPARARPAEHAATSSTSSGRTSSRTSGGGTASAGAPIGTSGSPRGSRSSPRRSSCSTRPASARRTRSGSGRADGSS